jgi:DNA repair exonuclease SbcCD nuclease subunit
MVEFLVFSDIQFYTNTSKSFPVSNGNSSWFEEQLEITRSIFKYAIDNNIETVIFNGDLFEEKSRISTHMYNEVWNLFRGLSTKCDITFNTGNHDLDSANRDSSLRPFTDVATVITFPTDIIMEDYLVRIVPYEMVNAKSLELNRTKAILFTHEMISGLGLSPTDLMTIKPLDRLLFKDWDLVFNGHMHKPQTLDNIVNIGSPMIQDWSEANDSKRFIHYKDGEVISIPINHPKFYEVDGISDIIRKKIGANLRDFFRISINSESLSDPVFNQYNVSPRIVKTKKKELRLEGTISIEEEIEKYVQIAKTDLDKDKLVSIAKDLTKIRKE